MLAFFAALVTIIILLAIMSSKLEVYRTLPKAYWEENFDIFFVLVGVSLVLYAYIFEKNDKCSKKYNPIFYLSLILLILWGLSFFHFKMDLAIMFSSIFFVFIYASTVVFLEKKEIDNAIVTLPLLISSILLICLSVDISDNINR